MLQAVGIYDMPLSINHSSEENSIGGKGTTEMENVLYMGNMLYFQICEIVAKSTKGAGSREDLELTHDSGYSQTPLSRPVSCSAHVRGGRALLFTG